jgi:hypothetical protein
MLKRIAALEETIAELPPASAGPRPLNDNDIEEIKREIARLKALPPVPAKPPTDARPRLPAPVSRYPPIALWWGGIALAIGLTRNSFFVNQ